MGHKHQTTDAQRIRKLLDGGCTIRDLAAAFCVNEGSLSGWIKRDTAPGWTRVACEAIERRRGKSHRKIIVCEVSNSTADIIMAIVAAANDEMIALR